jgi:hypothetical protein
LRPFNNYFFYLSLFELNTIKIRFGPLLKEKNMGRPINSRYLGDAVDSIKVSHSFNAFDGAETAGGNDTYIVSQRSTNKFLVADASDGWEEILTLVDKDAGTLAAGEFRIDGFDDKGTLYNVARLYNRTLRLGSADGTFVKSPWEVDGGAGANLAITGVSIAAPAVVTVADASTVVEGDTVTIDGIVGTAGTDGANGLNGNSYVTANVTGTTFELVGSDTSGLVYTSGGVVSGVGVGGLDEQDA